ncbi:hypothetical protein HY310_02115, partial [Candidatus Microgenomates bacterium]|nr:hypothetical protein [Candidatus Microgenomates bacterium]
MSLAILAIFFVTFPILFLSITTDAFVLPKQIALIFSLSLFFLFFILKSITAGKLSFRTSPFDLPVFIFIVAALLSAIFSYNRYDALIAFVPLLFIVLLYYGMVNVVKGGKQLLVVLSSLVVGGVISSIISIASFFKIYILPFNYTHVQGFTTFGSLLDQAIYFALMLPIAGYFAYSAYTAARVHRAGHATPFQAASAHREKGS